MSSSGGKSHIPLVLHAGVRLTLNNGDQYLLHKGPNYGKSSDTVITPAEGNWKTVSSSQVKAGKTVNDFMKNALPNEKYSVLRGNHCQAAARKAFAQRNK